MLAGIRLLRNCDGVCRSETARRRAAIARGLRHGLPGADGVEDFLICCLDPLVAVDPLVRRFWLSRARSLAVAAHRSEERRSIPFRISAPSWPAADRRPRRRSCIPARSAGRGSPSPCSSSSASARCGRCASAPRPCRSSWWLAPGRSRLCAPISRQKQRQARRLKGAALATLFSVVTWNMATDPLHKPAELLRTAPAVVLKPPPIARARPAAPVDAPAAAIDLGPMCWPSRRIRWSRALYHRNNRGNHPH